MVSEPERKGVGKCGGGHTAIFAYVGWIGGGGVGAGYKNMVVTGSTTTEAEGRREPTQHGLLSRVAEERGGGWTMICTVDGREGWGGGGNHVNEATF